MFDYVVTCFDYDYTGIKLANLLRKKYNFHPFFFNNSFDNKDAFEYTSINDISSLRTLIQQQYNLYKYEINLENQKLIQKLNFIQ